MFQLTAQGAADGLLSAAVAGAISLAVAPVQASDDGADPPGVEDLVRELGLEAHVEGGFFRRTYAAEDQPGITTPAGERYLMTSIFYLLTSDSPIGHFHRNRSDIVHYYHIGDPVSYYLLHPDGSMETVRMGSDLLAGQQLQLTVPGGVWKASRLNPGRHGYGLVSEAVAPGFDYADMTLADRRELQASFPLQADLIAELTRDEAPGTQ